MRGDGGSWARTSVAVVDRCTVSIVTRVSWCASPTSAFWVIGRCTWTLRFRRRVGSSPPPPLPARGRAIGAGPQPPGCAWRGTIALYKWDSLLAAWRGDEPWEFWTWAAEESLLALSEATVIDPSQVDRGSQLLRVPVGLEHGRGTRRLLLFKCVNLCPRQRRVTSAP